MVFRGVSAKAYSPMEVTESGIVKDSNAVPEKASLPMLVTLLPMITSLSSDAPIKANSPMLVTESGIVTEVNLVFSKALLPMLVTESGITTDVNSVC
jgi:hypothetical protein